ncbi:MAG TPA: DUF1684 domain-containing protein [Actinomycetota bacterium]|nr:DUF1684 domain-containing protein [Actinomycetota bacterium]
MEALLDWKRAVFSLYAEIRQTSEPEAMWRRWRSRRDELFAGHPQSPLTAKARRDFRGLEYFDYDPAMRVLADVEPAEPQRYEISTSGDGTYSFVRYGIAHFVLNELRQSLELYWLEGYGGGVFLPFRDGTSGADTYGAGRYLLDSIKGADLGTAEGRLVLDFNFAYNPSCAYDPRWVCPLAPPPNRLDVEIRAGERYP